MSGFRVLVSGEPVTQGRPRFTMRGGFPRVYDPKKSRDWKEYAKLVMLKAMREGKVEPMTSGPVEVTIWACHELRPSYHRKRNPPGRRWKDTTPDAENCAKAALDSAQSAGVFRNDSQVARLVINQFVGAQGEKPFLAIEFNEIKSDELLNRWDAASSQNSESISW